MPIDLNPFDTPYPGDTQAYLQDPEFQRLVKRLRDSHSGRDYQALAAYYTSKYGPIPEGYNLWSGKLDKNDSLAKTAAVALPLMAGGVYGAEYLASLGLNGIPGDGDLETPGTVNAPDNSGDWTWDSTLGKWIKRGANAVLGGGNGFGIDDIIRMVTALGGGAAALAANKESDADKALKQKQLDLLGIQEGRLKEQGPLFSDVQHMTRAMLPIFGRKDG